MPLTQLVITSIYIIDRNHFYKLLVNVAYLVIQVQYSIHPQLKSWLCAMALALCRMSWPLAIDVGPARTRTKAARTAKSHEVAVAVAVAARRWRRVGAVIGEEAVSVVVEGPLPWGVCLAMVARPLKHLRRVWKYE